LPANGAIANYLRYKQEILHKQKRKAEKGEKRGNKNKRSEYSAPAAATQSIYQRFTR